jgi:hypothetical protein
MNYINEIEIGPNPEYNNMIMFRKYDSETGFKTRFVVNYDEQGNQTLDWANNIIIPYIEFFKNSNGQIVDALTRKKIYIVGNISATYYTEGDDIPEGKQIGDIKTPAWPAANNWFFNLARTPITQQQQIDFLTQFRGILDSIEYTLRQLPMNVPDRYILQPPV